LAQFEGYHGGNWQGLGGVIDVDQDTYVSTEKTSDDDALYFYTSGIERAKINNNGNVYIAKSFYTSGSAYIESDLTVSGDLNVSGNFNLGDSTTDRITTQGDLYVKDDAFFSDAVHITGNLTVDGTASAATPSSNGHLTTKLYVDSSDNTLTTNLATTGTTLQNQITSNDSDIVALNTATGSLQTQTTSNDGDISALNTATGSLQTQVVNNDTDISTLQTATGSLQTQVTSNDGDITDLNTKVTNLSGDAVLLAGGQTIAGSKTFSDNTIFSSGVTVLGTLGVSGNFTLGDDATDSITTRGDLFVEDDAVFSDDMTVTGNARFVGNVGIGVGSATPSAQLELGSSGGSARYIRYKDTDGSPTKYNYELGVQRVDQSWTVTPSTLPGGNSFSSPALIVNSDGNVGVGAAPSKKFQVESSSSQIKLTDTGQSGSNSQHAIFNFSDSSDNSLDILTAYAAGTANKITLSPAGSTAMTLLQGGKVGIGVNTPTQTLHVDGNLRLTGAIYDTNNSAGTNGQILISTGSAIDWKSLSEITGVDGTGTANYIPKWSDADTIGNSIIYDDGTNVGIGSASPSYRLDVQDSSDATFRLQAGSTSDATIRLDQNGTQQATIGYDHSSSLLKLNNNSNFGGTDHLVINSDGNVGLGITTPSVQLQTSGDVIVGGNLTVSGTTFTVDTSNVLVEDPVLLLAKNQTGGAALDSGFIVERGSDQNVGFIWDESSDHFTFINTNEIADDNDITIASYANIKAANAIVADLTSPNGYFDWTRNSTSVAAKITQSGTGDILNLFDGASNILSVLDGGNVKAVGNFAIGGGDPVATKGLYILQDGGTVTTDSYGLHISNTEANAGPNDIKYGLRVDSVGTHWSGNNAKTYGLYVSNTDGYSGASQSTENFGAYIAVANANPNKNWGLYVTGEDKSYFSGNVGIGTTAPTYKLQVVGTSHFSSKLIAAGSVGIGVTNPSVSLEVVGTDAIRVPVGTDAQRPTPADGMVRLNTDSNQFEGYSNSNWQGLGGVIDVDQDTYVSTEKTTDDDTLFFYTAGGERAKIDNAGNTFVAGDLTISGSLAVSGDFTLGDTTTDKITTRGDLYVEDDAFFADAVEITGSLTVDGTASAATPTQNGHLTTKLYVDSADNTLTTNLATSGTTLQNQITSNDSDITALNAATGSLQTQVTSNDSDISTLTTNLAATGSNLQAQITSNDGDVSALQTATGSLQTQVSSNDTDIATINTNITSLSGDAVLLAGNQTIAGDKTFSDDVTILGDLAVSGDFTLGDATTDKITTRGDLYVEDDAVFSDTISVTGVAHFAANVGIGTASPSVALDISATDAIKIPVGTTAQRPATADGLMRLNTTTNQFEGYQNSNWQGLGGVIDVDQDTYVSTEKTSDDDTLFFYTAGSEKARLTSAGLFGIGTSAPGYTLEVAASSATWLSRIYNTHGGVGNGLLVRVDSTSSDAILSAYSAGSHRFVVKGDGKVGIGTYSPSYKLHVAGDYIFVDSNKGIRFGGSSHQIGREASNELRLKSSNTTGFTTFYTGGDTEKMRILADGKVGIGTTAPSSLLHISSTSPAFYIQDSDATSTHSITSMSGGINFTVDTRQSDGTFVSTDYQIVKDASGANYQRWFTQGAERMRIISDGNVGIGTATPSAQLQTTGDVIVGGNLTVSGTTFTVDTSNVLVEDPVLLLAKNQTGGAALDAGFIVERGSDTNVGFIWDESADQFAVINTTEIADDNDITIASYAAFKAGSLTTPGNITTTGTGTITSASSLTAGGTLYVDENIRHTADTNNYINFTTDTQKFYTSGSERMRIASDGVVTTNNLEPINGNDSGYLGSSSKKWKQVYFGILEADTAKISGLTNLNGMQYFVTMNSNGTLYKDSRTFLELTGGTLTGALIGTTATFTTVTAALVGNATTSTNTTGNAATVTNGVYTTGAQTIGGAKTLTAALAGTSAAFSTTLAVTGNTTLTGSLTGTTAAFSFAAGNHTTGIAVTNTQNGGYGTALTFSSKRTDESTPVIAARIRTEGASSWNSDASTSSNLKFDTVSADIAATRMTIFHDGKVGIGTTSPEKNLTVQSATSPAIGIYSTYADTNARNWAINTNNAAYGDLTFSTSAARLGNPTAIKMTILKDGKVGIGTTAPAVQLHQYVAAGNIVEHRLAAATVYTKIIADDAAGFSAIDASHDLRLKEAGAEIVRITGGKVGIGTTAPGAKLEVAVDGLAYNAPAMILEMGTSGSSQGVFEFQSNSVTKGRIRADEDGGMVISSMGSGDILFRQDDADGSTLAVMKNDGKVGIGTTAPLTKTHINAAGSVIVGGNAIKSSTMKGLSITNSTNDTSSVGVWFGTGGSHWSGISGQRLSTSTWGTDLRFYTHEDTTQNLTYTSERMRIATSGSVGIGTATPNQLLHLEKGDTNTNELATGAGPQIKLRNTSDTNGNIASIDFYNSTGYITGRMGAKFVDAGDRNTDLYFATRANSGSLTTQMRIKSDGNVDITSGNLQMGGTNIINSVLDMYNLESFKLADTKKAFFGSSNDLEIYHDGSHSYISNTTGAFWIKSTVTDGDLIFAADRGDGGGTFDYFTLDGGSTTYSGGTTVAYTKWQDNSRIALGTGKDLQLYHDGNHSYIEDTGTGALKLKSDDFRVENSSGNNLFKGVGDVASMYHNGSEKLATTSTGATVTGDLLVTGQLSATTKSFLIDHPTKPGKKLRHGSLEGPENGVYIRGKSGSNIIELPEYWTKLIDEDSITVQLTPIGKHQHIYVESIKNNTVHVQSDEKRKNSNDLNYFYLILAERKDVNKLVTEE